MWSTIYGRNGKLVRGIILCCDPNINTVIRGMSKYLEGLQVCNMSFQSSQDFKAFSRFVA